MPAGGTPVTTDERAIGDDPGTAARRGAGGAGRLPADDVDPVVLLDRLALNCLDLVGADAVGVMIAGVRGELRLMAVTDQSAALME